MTFPARHGLSLISLAMAGLLTGCSAGGNFNIQSSAKPANLPALPSLRVAVNPKAEGSDEVLADVRSAIVAQLISSGRFSTVIVANAPTDLVMNADIEKFAKVTVGERILVGTLAGRNRVNLTVQIIQPSTNTIVETYEATGESAAHPLSSESGLSDAVREAAKEVAAGATF